MSGPGADDGEERARSHWISDATSTGKSLKGSRRVVEVPIGQPGKKCPRRALLGSSGVEAPGSSGKGGQAAYSEPLGHPYSLWCRRRQERAAIVSLGLLDCLEV